ncbi:MAG: carboxypeptidase regulatory-like domain-containing protein, partial [Bryobacterales bacterium]|nr:carboxypeptidase regulatory-like domain-containing protein [Bryobacterales bacterium]
MRPSLARLAILLAGSALGVAQQLSYLSGVVQDTSASSIPEAAVALVNEETGFRRTARTNQDGGYAIPALQPGTYKVTVRKEGFRTVVRFGVKLDVAQPARVDF